MRQALEHIPVGLWFGSVIFDLTSFFAPPEVSNFFVVSSYFCILLGTLGGLAALTVELVEYGRLSRRGAAFAFGAAQIILNAVLIAGYILQLYFRDTTRAEVGGAIFIGNVLEIIGVSALVMLDVRYDREIETEAEERESATSFRKAA